MRFLMSWQRVAPASQVEGAESLSTIVEQLEGFEAAAGAWESEILASRLAEYQPEWLDSLCLSGRVVWARLSPTRKHRVGSDSLDAHCTGPEKEHCSLG
jgi:ATP-dependent Lhr-like helicase